MEYQSAFTALMVIVTLVKVMQINNKFDFNQNDIINKEKQ